MSVTVKELVNALEQMPDHLKIKHLDSKNDINLNDFYVGYFKSNNENSIWIDREKADHTKLNATPISELVQDLHQDN